MLDENGILRDKSLVGFLVFPELSPRYGRGRESLLYVQPKIALIIWKKR